MGLSKLTRAEIPMCPDCETALSDNSAMASGHMWGHCRKCGWAGLHRDASLGYHAVDIAGVVDNLRTHAKGIRAGECYRPSGYVLDRWAERLEDSHE